MNAYIATVIVAPLTTHGQGYPSRVSCQFAGKDGRIVLDQICTVDKDRLVKKLGKINPAATSQVMDTLAEMFAA